MGFSKHFGRRQKFDNAIKLGEGWVPDWLGRAGAVIPREPTESHIE